MVDLFALALTHGLLALAAWRLVLRADLDSDTDSEDEVPPRPGKRGPRV